MVIVPTPNIIIIQYLYFILLWVLLSFIIFLTLDLPIISSSVKAKKTEGVGKEDLVKLISIMETLKPLWDHRLSLGERSENIKNNMWNEVFVQFNGKIFELIMKLQISNNVLLPNCLYFVFNYIL